MTESYSQWYERHSPPGKILATQYTSAEPIRYNGSLVYPMYSEEFGTPGARLAMTALSAAPPAGLRGWGIGLSVLGGHVRFDGRRLGGIDVWGDALATGLSVELAGNSAEALFTLTPVWVDDRGVQKSWEGNYGILVEHLPDGRITLWCSVGEGPPNFANLVVEIATTALDAEPAAPQENEAQLLDDQYVTLPVRYRAERPDGGRVVLVDTGAAPEVKGEVARRAGGWVSRRDYAPPADGSAGHWDRQAPEDAAVRRPSGELPPVPEGLGEESPFGPGVGSEGVVGGNGEQVAGGAAGFGRIVGQPVPGEAARRSEPSGRVPSGAEERPDSGAEGSTRRSSGGNPDSTGSGEQANAGASGFGQPSGRSAAAPAAGSGARAESGAAGFGRAQAERKPGDSVAEERRRADAGVGQRGVSAQAKADELRTGLGDDHPGPTRPADGPALGGGRGRRPVESGREAAERSRATESGRLADQPGRPAESGPQADEPGRPAGFERRAGEPGRDQPRNDGQPPARSGGQHVLPTRTGRRPDIRESRYGQRPTAAGEKLTGRHGQAKQGRPATTGAQPSAPGTNLAAGLHGMRGDESDQRRESFAARLQALRGERSTPTQPHRHDAPEQVGEARTGSADPSGGPRARTAEAGSNGSAARTPEAGAGGATGRTSEAGTSGTAARTHETGADGASERPAEAGPGVAVGGQPRVPSGLPRRGGSTAVDAREPGAQPTNSADRLGGPRRPAPADGAVDGRGENRRNAPGRPASDDGRRRADQRPADVAEPRGSGSLEEADPGADRTGAQVAPRPHEVAPNRTETSRIGDRQDPAGASGPQVDPQPHEVALRKPVPPRRVGRADETAPGGGTTAPQGGTRPDPAGSAAGTLDLSGGQPKPSAPGAEVPTPRGEQPEPATPRLDIATPRTEQRPRDPAPSIRSAASRGEGQPGAAAAGADVATPRTEQRAHEVVPGSGAPPPGGGTRPQEAATATSPAGGRLEQAARDSGTAGQGQRARPEASASVDRRAAQAADPSTGRTADPNAARTADPKAGQAAEPNAARTDREVPRQADGAAPQAVGANTPRRTDADGPQSASRNAAQRADRAAPHRNDQNAAQQADRNAPQRVDRSIAPADGQSGTRAAEPSPPDGTLAEEPTGFGGWSAATLQHNPDTLPPRRSVYGPPPVPRGQGGIIGDPGYRGALYDLGLAMYRRGDTESARGLLTQAAEAGHVAAAYDLGSILRDEGDRTGAEAWWRAAAAHGEPRAAASLKELREG
ncbi:hypothetical protein [Nocardia jiangsuensis]|uniref:TPR repeat protein n=1 Tax=Nocardia jiangsuensis TaxID=1691563 RepID=A0ABV8DNN7_9NOCA